MSWQFMQLKGKGNQEVAKKKEGGLDKNFKSELGYFEGLTTIKSHLDEGEIFLFKRRKISSTTERLSYN